MSEALQLVLMLIVWLAGGLTGYLVGHQRGVSYALRMLLAAKTVEVIRKDQEGQQ